MSYAAVAAENAQPASQQPRPNPALLNTTAPTHSSVADDALKINIVAPDFKEHPRTTTSEARTGDFTGGHQIPASPKDESHESEVQNMWEATKCFLFRPGVAGGLIGISTNCYCSYSTTSNPDVNSSCWSICFHRPYLLHSSRPASQC
jgi:hypothetical protein